MSLWLSLCNISCPLNWLNLFCWCSCWSQTVLQEAQRVWARKCYQIPFFFTESSKTRMITCGTKIIWYWLFIWWICVELDFILDSSWLRKFHSAHYIKGKSWSQLCFTSFCDWNNIVLGYISNQFKHSQKTPRHMWFTSMKFTRNLVKRRCLSKDGERKSIN